ncbi:hypothetical protein DYH09_01060 [bacterium CPR1]|nr:hypothetical protein [bacterium CPR1]
MTIQTFNPGIGLRGYGTVASTQAAPTSELDKFKRSEETKKKNSLWGKMGVTALGVGSVAGTVGWALRASMGWANAFPICTMVGLAAGAALGATAWAIEHNKAKEEREAARQASA